MALNSFLSDTDVLESSMDHSSSIDKYRRMCAEKALSSVPQKKQDKTILFYESNPLETADHRVIEEFLERSDICYQF